MADNGDVLLITADKYCPSYHPARCDARLYARVGPDISRLSPPELLAEGGYIPAVSVSPNGHMLVAWRTADGSVDAAIRGPGADFSRARQRLSEPSAPAPPNGWGGSVSPSINNRGEAAVAWQEWSGQTGASKVAFTQTNSGFAPAQTVGPLQDESSRGMVRVAVDSAGGAVIAVGGPDAAFSWRPPGGSAGPLNSFRAGPAWFLDVLGRPDTQVVSLRDTNFGPATIRVVSRETGGPFGPARILRLPGISGGHFGGDSRGNLHVGWQDDGAGGPMRAATLSRFDLEPSEVTGPLSSGGLTSLPSMAVNARGQAAMLWSVPVDLWSSSRDAKLMLAERAPDADPPALGIRVAARGGGRVRARLRCNEACRAGATVTVSRVPRRRARGSLSSKGRPIMIRPGAEGLIATRLKPAERRRLRALVRRKRRLTAIVRVTVDDAWGNRRVATRRLSVKRLLR